MRARPRCPTTARRPTIAATLPVAVAALLRARNGQGAAAARSGARHGRRSPAHDQRRRGRGAPGRGARRLSHDRHRQRPGHVDLRGAGDRLDPRLARRRGARRLLRVHRRTARRRARPGARHARRDRRQRRHRPMARPHARRGRAADGLRPPRRSAFATRAPTSCARPCCGSIRPAGASPSRRRSSGRRWRRCNGASPDGAWRPISRWTRRCCSTPSACRAKRSRRSSPWRARAAWIAHALEQQASGRMIRPASTYIGPVPAR